MSSVGLNPDQKTDIASIHIRYKNGSLGVINYFSNGSKAYSKERVEVYFGGKTLILDNFRQLEGFDTKGFSSMKGKLDKGHEEMFRQVVALNEKGGAPLFTWASVKNTHLAAFGALESLKTHSPVRLEDLAVSA